MRLYVERHDEAFLSEARRQSIAAAALGWTEDDEAWERLGVAWDDPEPASNSRSAAE